MAYDVQAIEKSMVDALNEMGIADNAARDIAFHMTDWIADFQSLQALFENPGSFSNEQISDLLMNFLLHVPNHVAAAMKLISGFPVTDVFEVGAVSDT